MRGEKWTADEAITHLRQWMEAGLTIAGVDESGRGPLAGPVVAAAVVLPPQGTWGTVLHELMLAKPSPFHDSKQLRPKERERLFRLLRKSGAVFAVGKASPTEIDRFNIRQATVLAMRRALKKLDIGHRSLSLALVDGDNLGDLGVQCIFIIDGDEVCPLISAASIIAKVTRDRLMRTYDRRYPQYGFAQHKGYATKQHLEALLCFGPCPIHRKSFAPVRERLAAASDRCIGNWDEKDFLASAPRRDKR